MGEPRSQMTPETFHFEVEARSLGLTSDLVARGLGYAGAPVHDAVAVTALVRPDLLVTRDLFVEVETGGDYCRGATIGDYYGISGKEPNVRCITDIDRQGFVDLLVDAVSRYGKGEGV